MAMYSTGQRTAAESLQQQQILNKSSDQNLHLHERRPVTSGENIYVSKNEMLSMKLGDGGRTGSIQGDLHQGMDTVG